MEDYCHSIEHSIEFQVLFLQYLYGPDIRILPILCGSYARSIYGGGAPEDDEHVRRFLGALGDLAAKEGDRLFWVLGIDMAHMGRRYGDRFVALADQGEMAQVAGRDRQRIDRINAGDARRLLGPGAGAARRFEMVRVVAALHISQSGAASARRAEPLRTVEYRRAKRGQLRGNVIQQGGLMRRRTFLTTAPAAAMAASAAASPAPGEGIRLGFDSYSIRNFKWKAIQLIDYAGSHKLDTIQISSLDDYESLEPAHLKKVKDQAARYGMTIDGGIGCICPTSGSWKPQDGDPGQYILKGLRVAKAVGATGMRCFVGSAPDRRGKLPIEAHMESTIKVLRGVRSAAAGHRRQGRDREP